MLNAHELAQLCHKLGLSPLARSVIEQIRSSSPSRRVRNLAGNVTVRYPSRKMGFIIQAESHRNELAGIYEKEHDRNVLEYYDQPPRIKLVYRAKSGRQVGVLHTPDFFVIRSHSVGWEEWKMEQELQQLSHKMPARYVRGEDGNWRCPPGEQYAEQFGFCYQIKSSADIDWIFQRNILFLEDYLRDDCSAVSEEAVSEVLALVTRKPGLTLAELLRCAEVANSDDIYRLMATESIYADVRRSALAETEQVRLFSDQEMAQAYTVIAQTATGGAGSVTLTTNSCVVWDSQRWTIVNSGETTIALLAEDGTLVELPHSTFEAMVKQGRLSGRPEPPEMTLNAEVQELLARASPDDLKEANRRYAIIAPRLIGQPITDDTTPARTIRHWLSRWREAEQSLGCGYSGLLPRRWKSGNYNRKLPDSTLVILEEFILNDYETLKQKPKFEVYGALLRVCEERGLSPPSYKTFAQAVNHRPRQEQVGKRQGRRAAYQHEPFYRTLTLTTPRHGDRPFEIGHIDHTQLDIELLCSRTGRNLGRPWATFLSDAFSRRLLAVSLTFDPPSYRACMMVLRECVRRHGRLSQIIVVDGGREFESVYFETLLARYECTKKTRPAGKSRFGSVCERLFGTTNTRFIYNLAGNTQMVRNVRQVTQAVDPKMHARWSLGKLYSRLCEWAYEIYDTLEHPALGQTPRETFTAGLVQSGRRLHRLIAYDEAFRLFTLPTTRKGTAKVQPRSGVKINHLFYWSDVFLDPKVENTQVPVRYDPFDAGQAYAFAKGKWVSCISEHYAHFAGRSEREMMLATAELRKRNQRHGQQFSITARRLADFLASLEAEELLLEQRLRDAEVRDVFKVMADTQGYELVDVPSPTKHDLNPKREQPFEVETNKTDPDATLVIYEDY